MEFWVTQTFNGISYGALLFLLAGGLSLIFGMMRIVNMTHGSYYLLGGYVALTVIWQTGYFALGILVGAVAIELSVAGEEGRWFIARAGDAVFLYTLFLLLRRRQGRPSPSDP